MSLALLDGVIGRQQSAIGMVPNRRKPGLSSVERATSAAPPRPAEHAMIEAAIQLDLITPEQAEALVHKAHQVCPYSNATRNNIDVKLTVE